MAYVFQTLKKNGKPHPKWRFEYRDRFGRKRKGTGLTSKGETQKLANRKEAEESAIRKGHMDAPKDPVPVREFKSVATEYLAWGDSQGGRGGRPWGTRHSLTRHRHLEWWPTKLSLRYLSDLEGALPRVEEELRELQALGRSGRTVAQHAESLTAFCKWCVDRDYFEKDPLRKLKGFDITPQTTRRALTPEELERLLAAAPIERRFLYEVALSTGLRANELRNLTVDHLDVDGNRLRLDAAWTKNRKPGFQPLPEDLVARLVEFVQTGYVQKKYERFYCRKDVRDAPQNALLYILSNPVKAFDDDLKTARIQKTNQEGKLDFHALRVTYATLVIESGATVKEAQTLLRHSTPDLTMNTYAKVRQGRLGEVTEQVARALSFDLSNAKNGQPEPSTGHNSAPKFPQKPEEAEKEKVAKPSESDGCMGLEMVEGTTTYRKTVSKPALLVTP